MLDPDPSPSDDATGAAAPRQLRTRGSNQDGVRQFNERVVLQALRVHGSLPKAELARLTGLTAQTIGLITARLEDLGLLLREPPVRGRIGQPSVPIALNPDGAFAIGIKVGRRSAEWLLVDFSAKVRARAALEYEFPDTATLLPAIERNLRRLLRTLGPLEDRVVGVGVAAPFQLGGWHRMLGLTEDQARAWNELDLRQAVQERTRLPVSFAKDTTAACVAELLHGRGRDVRNFLYLFVDTFVGGGLVLDAHLHRGVHGNAGAVASLPLSATGGKGAAVPQLLGQASLWELEQRFRDAGLDPAAAYDERALASPWDVHTRAWKLLAARGLAFTIVSGTAFLDMEAVVLDGAMAPVLKAQLLEATRQALGSFSWEGLLEPPRLLLGEVGSQARALGGALLPLHASFAPEHGLFLKD